MSCKIRPFKKNRLFEEGEQNNAQAPAQPAQAQPAPANNAQPAQNNAQAQPAQNQSQQPVQNNANGQQQQNANQNADAQQNNQEQQKDPKLAEREEKVTNCINGITEVMKSNDPYKLLAFDMPKYMEEQVPGFANEADAKDTIGKWEEFKKNPTKDAFDAMMNAFATFGNGGQPVQGNNQQNGQNAQQGQQQNPAQQVTTAQQESEYRSFSFGQRLNERLEEELRMRHTTRQLNEYQTRFGY